MQQKPVGLIPHYVEFFSRPTDQHDLVIIGGGVAGYVAAIKAGQEGLKALRSTFWHDTFAVAYRSIRWHV